MTKRYKEIIIANQTLSTEDRVIIENSRHFTFDHCNMNDACNSTSQAKAFLYKIYVDLQQIEILRRIEPGGKYFSQK